MGTIAYLFGNSVLRLGGPVGLASAALATGVMIAVSVAVHRKERDLQESADLNEHTPQPIAA